MPFHCEATRPKFLNVPSFSLFQTLWPIDSNSWESNITVLNILLFSSVSSGTLVLTSLWCLCHLYLCTTPGVCAVCVHSCAVCAVCVKSCAICVVWAVCVQTCAVCVVCGSTSWKCVGTKMFCDRFQSVLLPPFYPVLGFFLTFQEGGIENFTFPKYTH